MRLAALAIAGFCLATPLAAGAQEMAPPPPSPACATQDADLPAELKGWTAKVPLAAATGVEGLAQAALAPGQAYLASLPSTPAVTYPVQPEKPGGSVSHGGLFSLTIPAAGTYVVALGTAAWIDLLADGAPVRSASHGRGPACSTLRKMVAFDLQPGRYVVQISANGPAELPIMVAPRP